MYQVAMITILFITQYITSADSGSYQISLTPNSLSDDAWTNEGSMSSAGDITSFPGGVVSNSDNFAALCFDTSGELTYINYNTNSAVNPQLTMEIWIKPTKFATGKDWLLGHDNGGYDRSIIVYDDRYNGIAMGVGNYYESTVSYPELNEWTQIIATFDASTSTATIYKNGGIANGGEEQTVTISDDSGGEPNIGLNGLKNYDDHNFVGCIGQVQITNEIISARAIKKLYKTFTKTTKNANKAKKGSYEASYTCSSLESDKWENEGSLSDIDIESITGDITSDIDGTGINGICFSGTDEITYIDYNTNSYLNPQLTMEIWIYPTETPTGKDWLLGHDDGGYDRSIIVYDDRYNGIAMGVGNYYDSTVSYPNINEWTQIIATFDSITSTATVYKNGGIANGGEEQTVTISGDSGGESNIGLNGLTNYIEHTFAGCIGQVQITGRIVTSTEIKKLYKTFKKTVRKGCGNADDEMMYEYDWFNGSGFNVHTMYNNKYVLMAFILFSTMIICGIFVNKFYVKKELNDESKNNENSPLLINMQ